MIKHSYAYCGVYCKEEVKYNNNLIQEFSIKIVSTKLFNIFVGFAVIGLDFYLKLFDDLDDDIFDLDDTWGLFISNGKYKNCKDHSTSFFDGNYVQPKIGDIISICIDTRYNILFLKLNGQIWSEKRSNT